MASTVKKPDEVKKLEEKTNRYFSSICLADFLQEKFGFEEAISFSVGRWSRGRAWRLSDYSSGEIYDDDREWKNLYFNSECAYSEIFHFLNMYPLCFNELYDAICDGRDIYELLGVGDSVVRERLFNEIARLEDLKYEDVYNTWLSNEGEEFNKNSVVKDYLTTAPDRNAGAAEISNKGDNTHAVGGVVKNEPVAVETGEARVVEVIPDRETEGFGGEEEPKMQMEIFDFDTTVENIELINEPVCEEIVPTNAEIQNCLHGCIAYGENEDPEKIQAILNDLAGRTYLPQDMEELGQELAAKYGCEFNGCSIDESAREAVFNMLDKGETFNTKIDFATMVVQNGYRFENNNNVSESADKDDRNAIAAEVVESCVIGNRENR